LRRTPAKDPLRTEFIVERLVRLSLAGSNYRLSLA
jgi:hypothetical protein